MPSRRLPPTFLLYIWGIHVTGQGSPYSKSNLNAKSILFYFLPSLILCFGAANPILAAFPITIHSVSSPPEQEVSNLNAKSILFYFLPSLILCFAGANPILAAFPITIHSVSSPPEQEVVNSFLVEKVLACTEGSKRNSLSSLFLYPLPQNPFTKGPLEVDQCLEYRVVWVEAIRSMRQLDASVVPCIFLIIPPKPNMSLRYYAIDLTRAWPSIDFTSYGKQGGGGGTGTDASAFDMTLPPLNRFQKNRAVCLSCYKF
ncbi:hypothetical protein CEXT_630911 [Caerostris extrusa]|uniref:Uncharacterized protein n=1 Tax=Caerostris extrusa TaxID=172846 RepID=A0AAV4QDY3_CAEEX|nr:hypothetical protein CEXT_630911 [Caerostris extrusa]